MKTTMYIDYKAGSKKSYELYEIDRNEYPSNDDLRSLAFECMNNSVYLIRVFENNNELFTIRNR